MTENVANNVAQGNSQDLTEQWKKGWLDCGWYYVKGADGLFGMMSDYALYRVDFENPDNEISLLAKVPSYEEWKDTENRSLLTTEFSNEIDELNEENQQLKTLLSKWMHFYPIILYEHEDTLKTKDIVELFDKTREALK